jgi:hypothetical protein
MLSPLSPTPLSSRQALIDVIDEALKLLESSPPSFSSTFPLSLLLEGTDENDDVQQ